MKLYVDEQVQGYSKEFTTPGEMLEELNKVIDAGTIEVTVRKVAKQYEGTGANEAAGDEQP